MIDISQNRKAIKYTAREQFARVLWGLGKFMFRLSPRPCFGLRRFLLRCFGARIGIRVNIYPSTRIYFPWNLTVGDWSSIGEDAFIYNLGPVRIGERVTISHRAHLCAGTHDYRKPDMPLLKEPIEIGNEAWVCADAFIGPGVAVGNGAVIAARAVVVKSVEPWMIVGGNPARVIGSRQT